MVRLNCEALISMTAALLPGMVQRRRGVILNVASLAGFMPTPYMAVYGATKAFVISYSEALGLELSGSGVTVTALCPGPVTTDIYALAAPGVVRRRVPSEMSAQDVARIGLAGAAQGRSVVVPGVLNRLNVLSARLAPRALLLFVLRFLGLSYLGYSRRAFRS
jgi:short-subunit dehydrogenase